MKDIVLQHLLFEYLQSSMQLYREFVDDPNMEGEEYGKRLKEHTELYAKKIQEKIRKGEV